MEKIIGILITTIPILYQVQGLEGVNIDLIQYAPIICLNYILIVYFLKNGFNIPKYHIKIALLLYSAVIGMPIITFNINRVYFINSLLYLGLYLNFIIFILLFSNYMIRGNYLKTIRQLCIGNSILLFLNILINIKTISLNKVMFNILGIFNDTKLIESFGYKHSNLAAIYILIDILLIYLYFKNIRLSVKKNFYIYSILFILITCLIQTGSRTAIICMVIFIIVKMFFYIIIRLEKYLNVSIKILLLFVGIIIFINMNFTGLDLPESISIRIESINDIISYIKLNGNLIIGIGPSSVNQIKLFTLGIGAPDNGFIVLLIQYGIIGLSFILMCIGYLFKINLKNKNLTNASIIICLLFYSLTENVLFVPGVLISLIAWIFIITDKECALT